MDVEVLKKSLSGLSGEEFHFLTMAVGAEKTRRKRIRSAERRSGKMPGHAPVEMRCYDKGEAFSINSSECLEIPNISQNVNIRSKYFQALIAQDWSSVYSYDALVGDCYVYAHVDPSNKNFCQKEKYGGNFGGMPFYIGKGIGDRAYSLKRNDGHGRHIRQLIAAGFGKTDIVHIAFDGLSDGRALELEAKLIYFFGSIYQKDRKRTQLVNLEIPKTPKFSGVMVKVAHKNAVKYARDQAALRDDNHA